MKKLALLLSTLLLILSCSEESIKPAYQPQTFTDQNNGGRMQFGVVVDDLQVDEFGGEIGDVPVVGSVFQRLAGMFADISIDDENGTEVEIEPTYFEFPELEQVDFEYIKGVTLDKVHLKVANEELEDASLSFIKRIEVYLNVDPELPEGGTGGTGTGGVRPETDEEGGTNGGVRPESDEEEGVNDDKFYDDKKNKSRDSILLLTYDKSRDTLGCLTTCLDMRVHSIDWRKLLKKNRSFSIETKLVVDSVPKVDMKLGGEIKFSIFVDPGF